MAQQPPLQVPTLSQDYSDEELRLIASNPNTTPADLANLRPDERRRYETIKAQLPAFRPTTVSSTTPPSVDPADMLVGGQWESLLSMPATLARNFPALKYGPTAPLVTRAGAQLLRPLKAGTIPLATGLGAIGAAIDAYQADKGWEDILLNAAMGGARQGLVEATGGLIRGKAAQGAIRGTTPGLSKEGAQAALATPSVGSQTSRLRHVFGPGRSKAAVAEGEKNLQDAINARIGQFDESYLIPKSTRYAGFEDKIAKEVFGAPKESEKLRAFLKELERRKADPLDPLLAKPSYAQVRKIQTGKGFEGSTTKNIKNLPTSVEKQMDLWERAANQGLLETLDAQELAKLPVRLRALTTSLPLMNARLGGLKSLKKTLAQKGSEGKLYKRLLLGGVVGGAPGALYDLVADPSELSKNLGRYSTGGLLGAAAYGAFPVGSARAIKAAGEVLPTLYRGTGAGIALKKKAKKTEAPLTLDWRALSSALGG